MGGAWALPTKTITLSASVNFLLLPEIFQLITLPFSFKNFTYFWPLHHFFLYFLFSSVLLLVSVLLYLFPFLYSFVFMSLLLVSRFSFFAISVFLLSPFLSLASSVSL